MNLFTKTSQHSIISTREKLENHRQAFLYCTPTLEHLSHCSRWKRKHTRDFRWLNTRQIHSVNMICSDWVIGSLYLLWSCQSCYHQTDMCVWPAVWSTERQGDGWRWWDDGLTIYIKHKDKSGKINRFNTDRETADFSQMHHFSFSGVYICTQRNLIMFWSSSTIIWYTMRRI